MASRNVALKMEAYHVLEEAKRPGESFSDTVLRVFKGRRKVSEILAGFEPLDPATSKAIEASVRKTRKDLERSMKGRFP